MNKHRVVMKLNQQQLELIDRTVAMGVASDRTDLVHKALFEYAKLHQNCAQENTTKDKEIRR